MTKTFKPAQPFAEGPRPQIALTEIPEDRSSQIGAVGYDAASATLAVQFRRGSRAIYHYPNFSPVMHAEFIATESLGRYFGLHIEGMPFSKYPAETATA
jgi:hypothetical protein